MRAPLRIRLCADLADLLAVALWAGADVLAKNADQFHGTAKSALTSDDMDFFARAAQELLRVLDAPAVDFLENRAVEMFLESRLQAAQRDVRRPRYVAQAEARPEILHDKSQRPRHLDVSDGGHVGGIPLDDSDWRHAD